MGPTIHHRQWQLQSIACVGLWHRRCYWQLQNIIHCRSVPWVMRHWRPESISIPLTKITEVFLSLQIIRGFQFDITQKETLLALMLYVCLYWYSLLFTTVCHWALKAREHQCTADSWPWAYRWSEVVRVIACKKETLLALMCGCTGIHCCLLRLFITGIHYWYSLPFLLYVRVFVDSLHGACIFLLWFLKYLWKVLKVISDL